MEAKGVESLRSIVVEVVMICLALELRNELLQGQYVFLILRLICGSFFFFFFFFWKRTCYVALAGLELIMQVRLASNPQISTCLYIHNASN